MGSGTWIAIVSGYAMENGLLNGNLNIYGLIIATIVATLMLIFAIFVKVDKPNKKNHKKELK